MSENLPVVDMPEAGDDAVADVPARPAGPEEIAQVLRDSLTAEPPIPAAMARVLADAARALLPVVRATAGDVVLISGRDEKGQPWQGVTAGAYRFMSEGGSWSTPRLGDADFTWGERAREVLDGLEQAAWLRLAGAGRDHVVLLVRPSGAWLAQGGSDGSAVFHALGSDGAIALAGVQPYAEARTPADLFRSLARIEIAGIEEFARAAACPPEPEPAPIVAEEAGEPDDLFICPDVLMPPKRPVSAGLFGRLVRVGRRSSAAASA